MGWHKIAADFVGGADKVAGVLVANKTDIEAARVQVPELMGENFAKRHKLHFVSASAQRGVEVSTPFVYVARKFHDRYEARVLELLKAAGKTTDDLRADKKAKADGEAA